MRSAGKDRLAGEHPSPTVMRGQRQATGTSRSLRAVLQHPDFEQLLLHVILMNRNSVSLPVLMSTLAVLPPQPLLS